MIDINDYTEKYAEYFRQFNRLAVGDDADLSYGNDQPNATASSLESIIAYVNYAERRAKETNWVGDIDILNAGAGASSWMFRAIAEDHPELKLDITCIDPNGKYLVFVNRLLHDCGLSVSSMGTGFAPWLKPKYDHIYYDYGDIERIPYLGLVIDKATMSVYVDDVGLKQGAYSYREIVIKLCETKKLRWFDCEESLDSSNRAGIIIEKP